MTPFEAEMRRRVWWYICLIDMRFGNTQTIDMAISERLFDTKEPANVNDEDLWVNMDQPPETRDAFTDMSMTILRCELWRVFRRVHKYVSTAHSEQRAKNKSTLKDELVLLHRSIEAIRHKVLRHLDMEQPLHRLIETLSNVNFARAELLLNYKAHFKSQAAPTAIVLNMELKYGSPCVAALSSLEWGQQARQAEGNSRWGWAFRGCVPWDSLGVLLVGLLSATASGEWPSVCERAWMAVRAEVKIIPESLKVRTAS